MSVRTTNTTQTATDFGDFRLYLQSELAARCQRNPRYSLRSFAETLAIGSSDLSKLIRRQRRLTDKMLVKLAKRLDLEPTIIEAFRTHLSTEKQSRRSIQRAGATINDTFKQLDLDSFHLVADWYHLAILELLKVKGFALTASTIAKSLGITVTEANIAVDRLQRLGLLEINAEGRWIDKAGATTSVTSDYTDVAKKKLQRQILEKASTALDNVPIAERDQSAILMAVSTKQLAAAKILIRDFRRQLCALMEEGDEKDQVYYLSVSLFPVMKKFGSPSSGSQP